MNKLYRRDASGEWVAIVDVDVVSFDYARPSWVSVKGSALYGLNPIAGEGEFKIVTRDETVEFKADAEERAVSLDEISRVELHFDVKPEGLNPSIC